MDPRVSDLCLPDLVRDKARKLYGTTFLGGAFDVGTVYKLDTVRKETVQ